MGENNPTAERLRELLMWRKVVKAEISEADPGGDAWASGPTGTLTLDDGTVLRVWGNGPDCACSAGDYSLSELNTVDNAITNVEVEEQPGGDDVACRTCGKHYCYEKGHDYGDSGHYSVFVFAEDKRLKLAEFEGSDGNGYYGSGWWLEVSSDSQEKRAE